MCRKYQKVGQMEFGNKVDISDPCYERNGESNVIDYGIEKNEVERLKILYKYLLMLSGNKNEK